MTALPTFTPAELALHDGRNGRRALVGFNGLVYDLTSSYHWRRGRHWVQHQAGHDLTAAVSAAPHDAGLLARFPVVGRMAS